MLSTLIDDELQGPLLLFLHMYSLRNNRHHLGLLHQLVLVPPHLLLDYLVLYVLPHLFQAAGLFSCEGFADDLQPPRLVLRLRLGEALKELVRKDDGLDILELLSDRWSHIVFLEDLIGRVDGSYNMDQPLLVGRMRLVNPGDVQVPLSANLHKLLQNDLLQRSLHDRLHSDIHSQGAPVLLLEDVEEHGFIDRGRGQLGHVVSIPNSCLIEVLYAQNVL